MISIGVLFLASFALGDISEKLKQGQGLTGRPSNFQGLQPPLFGGGVKGGVSQKASDATNQGRIVIPSHHDHGDDEDNLERLCNDPFHSFLCKPVGPRKHRFDGNLRPGAVLPPGMFLNGASTNLRESKEPLKTGGALLSSEIDGYQYPKPSNNIPVSQNPGYSYPTPAPNQQLNIPQASNQNFQGYNYKKPTNPLPFPSNQVTTKAPPPGPAYQYLPALEPQNSQTKNFIPQASFNFGNNIAKPSFNAPQQVPFRASTPFPTLGTTSRPTTRYQPPTYPTQKPYQRPTFQTTQKPYQRPTFQTTQKPYQRPTFQTTQKPIFQTQRILQTPKPNFIFQAKQSQVVTSAPEYLPPFETPKPIFPPFQNSLPQATNLNKNIQKPSNQYLPSFAPTNQFPVAAPKPSNEYLPSENREGQSTNVEGSALLADEVDPEPRPLKKHERNHTLEELCNEAFHSFLCKPVTKPRKRIDGNIRPGAKIPPHVLIGAGSADKDSRLPPNKEGQALLPDEIDNQNQHPGYQYQLPQTFFDSTNLRNEYAIPNQFFIGAASDSLSLAKQFNNINSLSTQTFKPVEKSTAKPIPLKQSYTQGYSYTKPTTKPNIKQVTNEINQGYYYPKPTTTQKPKTTISDKPIDIPLIPAGSSQEQNGYNYPKPNVPFDSSPSKQNNGYYYPKPSTKPTTTTTTVKPEPIPAGTSNDESKGYNYPKPNVPFDSSPSKQNNGYYYPKPSTKLTTTTVKPEPIPAGTSNDESKGYNYPKPDGSNTFTLPTKKPQGYTYTKPPKAKEFTLPDFKPNSNIPFGTRLTKTSQGQYQDQEIIPFIDVRTETTTEDNDLPPASQFEILKP